MTLSKLRLTAFVFSGTFLLSGIFLMTSFCGGRSAYAEDPAAAAAEEVSATDEINMSILQYYIENNKINEAEAFLKGQLAQNPKLAQTWRALGLLAMQRKNYEEAKAALTKAAELSTGAQKGLNLYMLADVKTRAGDVEGAKKELKDAAKVEGFSDEIDKSVPQMKKGEALPNLDLAEIQRKKELREKEARAPQYFMSGSGSLKTGFDNNVLLLPDMPTDVIPASYFVSPSLSGMYFGRLWGGNLSVTSNGSASINTASAAQAFNSGALTFGGDWSTNPDPVITKSRWNVGYNVNLALTQADWFSPFSVGNTVTPGWTYSLAGGQTFALSAPVTYTKFPGVVITSSSDDRGGPTFGGNGSFRHSVGLVSVSETVAYSYLNSIGRNFRSHSVNAGLSGVTTLPKETLSVLSLGYSYATYPNNEQGRKDKKVNASIDLTRPLSKVRPITGGLNYGVEKSFSTLAVADYIKYTFSLKVQYEFR